VGTYPITPTQGTLNIANPNYVLDVSNFQAGTFTITPATLVITADPATRLYGAADPTFDATITGFIQGQSLATSDLTGSPGFITSSVATSQVGVYKVVPTVGTLKSADYLFSYVPNTSTITPAPLQIRANDTTQSFGTKPSLSATYLGLVNGDLADSLTVSPVLSTTATANSLPGNYPITVVGASSADYTITYKGATYTVQRASTTANLEGPALRSTVTSPVSFTVDVSASSLGSVPLTGLVVFSDQYQVIGAVPVASSKATLTTSALGVGNYIISAMYEGDNNYVQSSTGSIVQIIMSTTPAVPAKRGRPIVVHSRKPTPKPKSPAPKSRAHAVKPKPHPGIEQRAVVHVKSPVKQAVNDKKR